MTTKGEGVKDTALFRTCEEGIEKLSAVCLIFSFCESLKRIWVMQLEDSDNSLTQNFIRFRHELF